MKNFFYTLIILFYYSSCFSATPVIYSGDYPATYPDGSQSAVAGFRSLCQTLNSLNGGTLIIQRGTYKIDGTIDCSAAPYSMAANWTIVFEAGAKFKATPALVTSAFKIFSATPKTHTLNIYNADIDVSSASCNAACQGGEGVTALEVQDMKMATFYSPNLVGGTSYNNVNSNNGITCTRVLTTQIFGGYFVGFPNGGVYCVGDNITNSPNDYALSVNGSFFSTTIPQ